MILASQVAGVLYLLWRVGWTFQGANPALYVLLLCIDVLVVARHFVRISVRDSQHGNPRTSDVGMAPIAAVILDVGQEPLVEARVALRACMELRGATSVTVIDRLGRSDIEQLCRGFRVDRRVPSKTRREAHIANEVMNSSSSEIIVVIPASVWTSADAIELAARALNQPHLSSVGVPASCLGGDQTIGTGGYPLFPELDRPVAGSTPGVVAIRVDFLRKLGGFLGGNGDFVSRTLDSINQGLCESVSLGSGIVNRSAPWDEDLALRRRVDAVGRQQSAREAHRLIEAWAVVPRTLTLCLPAVVALTGWLPLVTSVQSAALFGLPWFVLAAMSRARMRASDGDRREHHWSDLRSGVRTITADFYGLVRGSSLAIPPGQIAARHLRVVGIIGVLGFVGCFAQLVGLHLNKLSDLAAVSVSLASLVVLACVRDTVWAQSDRERRVLPRSRPTQTNETVSGLSPYGADIAEAFVPGTELAFRVSFPQPGRNAWERNITGVVHSQTGESAGSGSYAQFDLDTATLDELLYFCGVTSPTLTRLKQPVPSGVVSLRKTGRERAIEPLRLTDAVIRSRGSFEQIDFEASEQQETL